MTKLNGKKLAQTSHPTILEGDFSDDTPVHLGIDIGSISCKLAVLDDTKKIRYLAYQRTQGRPMEKARQMRNGGR